MRGRLATTSIAELLVIALQRRLDGSFVFDSPGSQKSTLVVAGGRVTKVRTAEPVEPLGRLLTDSGVIDQATLEHGLLVAQERKDRLGNALVQLDALERAVLERTLREQLGRRLAKLAELPVESAFGFFPNVDLLEDRPECGVDPLSLIWRCLGDGRSPHPRQEALLASLRARPLGLRAGAALERFELSAAARACLAGLSARPLALDDLITKLGLDTAAARRLIYGLLLTRQLEPQQPGASVAPPVRSSTLPPPEPARSSRAPERLEHALERASRLVRERTRAEGAAEAARAVEAAQRHLAKKQYVEAERLVHQAVGADPGNAEHLALHAWLRMQNGELAVPALAEQIVAALDRAVMKAPLSVFVRFHRAQVLKRLGRDDEAFRDFRFVARRAPTQLDAVREVRLHLIRSRNKQKQSGVFSRLFLR